MSLPSWDSGKSGFSSVWTFCLDPGVEVAFLGLPTLETRVLSLFGVDSTTLNSQYNKNKNNNNSAKKMPVLDNVPGSSQLTCLAGTR